MTLFAAPEPTIYIQHFGYILMSILALAFLYNIFYSSQWNSGRLPRYFKYNKKNLFDIHLFLAVAMIKRDKSDYELKTHYVLSYVQRRYEDPSKDFVFAFNWAIKNKIKLKSITKWINKNITDLGQKSQMIYFLAGIAIVDGSINKHERKVLDDLARELHIPLQEVDAIIASYYEAHRRKQKAQQKKEYRSKPRTTASKRKQMAKILEVNENASFIEIKKAYRTLVKIHHPDRFQNDGPEQILLAKERFIEIQLAYEYFEARQ